MKLWDKPFLLKSASIGGLVFILRLILLPEELRLSLQHPGFALGLFIGCTVLFGMPAILIIRLVRRKVKQKEVETGD